MPSPKRDFRVDHWLPFPYVPYGTCAMEVQLILLRSLRGMAGTLTLKGRIVISRKRNYEKSMGRIVPYSR